MGDGILSETFPEIREAVRRLCARFPGEYWQKLDRERAYPSEFVAALTEAGFLSVLIPEEYDGSGLGLAIVQETAHQHDANVTIHDNPKSNHPDRPGTLMRVSFQPRHRQMED